MDWPTGIDLVEVTWGRALTVLTQGSPYTIDIKPLIPDTSYLRWAPTGDTLIPMVDAEEFATGAEGSAQLPRVDQLGWRDSAGNAYNDWAYKATIRYKRDRQRVTIEKVFKLVYGQTVIDLDALPDAAPGSPIVAAVPAVTSVNGQVGAVFISGGGSGTGASLEEVNQALVIPHINDTTPHPAYDDMPNLVTFFENGLS